MPGIRNKRVKNGITQIEILIAAALFLLIIAVTGEFLVMCVRSYNAAQGTNSPFLRASSGFQIMDKELRNCQWIYSPESSLSSEKGFSPEKGKTEPFIFSMYNGKDKAPSYIGYQVDKEKKSLERISYDPGFDYADPATHLISDPNNQIFVLAEPVREFRLKYEKSGHDDEFLRLYLEMESEDNFALATRFKIKGGYTDYEKAASRTLDDSVVPGNPRNTTRTWGWKKFR